MEAVNVKWLNVNWMLLDFGLLVSNLKTPSRALGKILEVNHDKKHELQPLMGSLDPKMWISLFKYMFPKQTTYSTRPTADTCSYCLQQVKVMLNLSASTVKYVHNSLDSTRGNSSSVKLWMEILCVLVWTQQSGHLISPRRLLSVRNSHKGANILRFFWHADAYVTWGFGAFNHQTIFQSRLSF